MSASPSSTTDFNFSRIQSSTFTHSHKTKDRGPNIIQYKPDGVSGIFAPKIIIHGKSYSSNSGLNELNSQPEASNSHSHSILYPIYPNNPTISQNRQNAQNQQEISTAHNSIYDQIMEDIFNTDNNDVAPNNYDKNFYNKLTSCSIDKKGHPMFISKCAVDDRIDIIHEGDDTKEALVCCKTPNYKGFNRYSDGARAGWSQGNNSNNNSNNNSSNNSNNNSSNNSNNNSSNNSSNNSNNNSNNSNSGSFKERWNSLTTKNNSVCKTFCDNGMDLIERKTGTDEDYCLKNKKIDNECLNKYQYRPVTRACIDNNCKNYQAKNIKKWDPNEVAIGVFQKKQYAIKEDPKFIRKQNICTNLETTQEQKNNCYNSNTIANARNAGVQLNCEDNKNCCHDARDKTECNQREDCRYCDSGNAGKTVCYRIIGQNGLPKKLNGKDKDIYLCDTGQGACVPTYGNNIPDLRHPYDNPNLDIYKTQDTKRNYEKNTNYHVIDYPLTCESSGYDFSGSYSNSRASYNSKQGGVKEQALKQHCRDNCPKDLSGNWLYPNSCSICD